MSAVLYTREERAQDNLYAALVQCRDLRLRAERHPVNSGAFVNTMVEREGWKTDAKARVFEMRAQAWKLSRLLVDMLRAEGIST